MFISSALRGQKKTPLCGTNAKLQHHKDFMPAYSVENEMPLIHHVVK
jgi:hypothetical protein